MLTPNEPRTISPSTSRSRPSARPDPSSLKLCAKCGAPAPGRSRCDDAVCPSCLDARKRMIQNVYRRMQAQNKIAALDPFLDDYEEDAQGAYEEEDAFRL